MAESSSASTSADGQVPQGTVDHMHFAKRRQLSVKVL